MPLARPRLLMADDHTLVLEGIRKLLETEFDLVGIAEDGLALLRDAQRLQPDVILRDISMPRLNGIEACRQLVKIMPEAKVIFLTMHADVVYVEEALSAGGMGYLLKRSAAAELTTAIHTVLRGNRYVTALIDSKESRMRRTDQWRSDGLTTRQRQVLQMVAEGCANKEIAVRLHVSEKTVDYHKSSIKRALKLSSTAELTQFAIKHRIIGV